MDIVLKHDLTRFTYIYIGHKWRSHRKLIAPTFHLNVLKSFIDLFNENSRQVVTKLNAELGKTFDAHDYMSEATVEILLGKRYMHTLASIQFQCFLGIV